MAVEKWGNHVQIDIAVEEMAELLKALMKFKRNEPELPNYVDDYIKDSNESTAVIEEIADVCIMMEQLKWMFGHDAVNTQITYKLRRLQERISPKVVK